MFGPCLAIARRSMWLWSCPQVQVLIIAIVKRGEPISRNDHCSRASWEAW